MTVDDYIEKYRKIGSGFRCLSLGVDEFGCSISLQTKLHDPTKPPEDWGSSVSKINLQVNGKTLIDCFKQLDLLYKQKHAEYIKLYSAMLESMKEEGLLDGNS